MQNKFYFNSEFSDIFEKPKKNSPISTQILFGESFKIIKKHKKFYKIKIIHDNYIGYIRKKKFYSNYKPSHKVHILKSKIYKLNKSGSFYKTNNYLPFLSKVEIIKKYKSHVMFKKNYWININDLKPLKHKIRNFINILGLFNNIKYKWGGRTFAGIDCSALTQLFYIYNNKFFPRDTVDQIKVKKGVKYKKNFKKGNIIFWKGHVGICLNSKKFLHAYGPKKKVVVMPIDKTIDLINKTAKLKVKKIFSI